ncbi:uncharacterized protein LOC133533163 isoform X1 [Cydia pomonella]|uniref:uncharacterized protein LOC133533163 isoform X1 n=2 Tax=Cydia pomonella TaxID=82600 RepID=UPI002ADE3480|nr:uncharacterized protein LOC133533163 isoform X1 [Cydia pomonella]
MSAEDRCKELIKKRASIKAKLTQFIAYFNTAKTCEQLSDSQLVELDMRIKKLDDSYDSFDFYQSELEMLAEDPTEQYTARELFERSYYKEIAAARELVDRHRSQRAKEVQSEVGSNECPTVVSYKHNNVRLPKINLPHFSGGYQNWLEFKDIYVSLIHSETSIDNINKFHYLRASLHGSAALVIRSLDFKGDNYDAAWKLLCERYDNKQLLVNNHVQALFNIEQVHKESSVALRQIVDNTKKNLNALATLDQPVEHWDTLIIHIMAAKLDGVTSREWEEHRNQLTNPPALSDFITFLTNRCNLLETLEEAKHNRVRTDTSVNNKPKSLLASASNVNKPKTYNVTCPLCNKAHYVFNCERALPVEQRVLKAKEFNVCLNCLRPGHNESKCKLSHCKYCKTKHNTLLHVHTEPKTASEHIAFSANAHNVNVAEHVLLSTALVKVRDGQGKLHSVRVLLDNGSTYNYITRDLSERLNLPIKNVKTTVSMLEKHESNITQSCSLKLESYDGAYSTDIECNVLSDITSPIPHTYIDVTDVPIPSEICLADPSYTEPADIEILLGAKIFWSVLGTNRIILGKNDPFLVETKLGWLLVGAINQPTSVKPVCLFLTDKQTDTTLTKFWELDTISPKHDFTPDENACEELFNKTTKRDKDGRFVVTVPLKESPDTLGDSYGMAKRRFLSLERRLDRDSLLKERYVKFMEEYEVLGHMSETLPYSSLPSYYLPHHAVLRESSTTTKLRVVFDASAATTSGKSFNDIQLTGPRVQDDLFSILLRFRQHKYVVSADIEKMYRQILVDDEQRQLQLILWRADPSKPLKIYSLNTVTYGTSSAPFLSTRCLLQLSQESSDKETQEAIARDFYVDDFLSGSHSIDDTVALCRNVTTTLKNAQFHLRKWQSNNEEILKAVGENPCLKECVDLSENELSKTLGLNWRCAQDSLTFRIDISLPKVVTKRHILSVIAQIFDPLGLVTPCIVQAKILMQKLWVNQCSWDDPLTGDILTSWEDFVKSLPYLNKVQIPRWVLCNTPTVVDFHVFTDASEKAYGACLYVRSVAGDGSVSVRLLASKSKVAPIKATTIPRLELCGALLGARLCTKVLESVIRKPDHCVFWCDSMIVMGWLSSSPCSLRPFVKNRISEIQESSKAACWRYVPSKENPADLVSRGLSADLIMNSSLWWSGPSFLKQDMAYWPTAPGRSGNESSLPEMLPAKSLVTCPAFDNSCKPIEHLIKNKSSYSKLQRIIAYILRFIHNCKKENTKKTGGLTLAELESASVLLLRRSQQDSFPNEYELLKTGKPLPKKSRLSSLSPFLDSGLIRVGGRLVNSFYDYGTKHPIVLCSKHHLARLFFKMFHLRLLHAPPQLLLATIKLNYWPLGGRNLAKQVVHTCLKCVRLKGETVQPVMGNLPKERLHLEYPFLETGTDYAGPILIADRKGRGCRLIKAYICIFVCLASKALHLELVSDLTKEAFMAALNRFIGRRGKPKVPAHRVSETALLEQVLQRVRYWLATENEMAELKGQPRRRNHGGNQGQELTAAYVAPWPHRSSAAWQRWRRKSSRHKDEKRSNSSGLQYNLSSTHTRS